MLLLMVSTVSLHYIESTKTKKKKKNTAENGAWCLVLGYNRQLQVKKGLPYDYSLFWAV